MKSKVSKTNESLAYFNARLDEVRISGYERMKAMTPRPHRRLTISAG